MKDMIRDLSAITTIPENTLEQLAEKVEWCICEDIEESQLAKSNVTEIDLEIGVLAILVEEGSIRYRFTPSKNLENSVRKTVFNKKSPLELNVENALIHKIMHTYKDLL